MMDFEAFREHGITQGLTDEELRRLEGLVTRAEFITHDFLCEQGSPTPGLIMIGAGEVDVKQQRDAQSTVGLIARLQAPTIVGELEFLNDGPSISTVEARKPVVAYVVSHEVFQRLTDAGDSMVGKIIRNIAQVVIARLVDANRRALELIDPRKQVDAHGPVDALTGKWELDT